MHLYSVLGLKGGSKWGEEKVLFCISFLMIFRITCSEKEQGEEKIKSIFISQKNWKREKNSERGQTQMKIYSVNKILNALENKKSS